MTAQVTVDVASGPQQGERWVYDRKDTFLFGRAEGCHARLSDEDRKVSRRHFLLEINPPLARLRDLGSRNGTFVNGVPFGGRPRGESPEQGAQRSYPQVLLHDGDHIRVGRSELRVSIEDGGSSGASGAAESPQAAIDRIVDEAPQPGPLQLPGWRIVRQLAVGGQGAVYLARDRAGGRVAIKTLLAKVAVDQLARARFEREIEILRRLEHPRVVAIRDYGALGDVFYFVMEYCEGGSLDDWLTQLRRPLTWAEARTPFLEVLEGMAFAHRQGFVHRDIKPANVLRTSGQEGGGSKVSDFGLAKSFEENGLDGLTLTKHGPAGTLPYMPHEQIESFRRVRPQTDVFALGATMYYALTLRYPREFNPLVDPVRQVLEQPCIPIARRGVELPGRVADVIDRALAYEVDDRHRDAGELYQDLASAGN